VVQDPERDSFIDVIVKPAVQLDRLDEVLVITSTEPRFSPEQQQDLADSSALKGAEAAAIKEQKKASAIMAERLPGLIDPNAPPDQQPLLDNSNPNPVARAPQALHPDRFTPGVATPAAQVPLVNEPEPAKPEPENPGQKKEGADGASGLPAPKQPADPNATPRRNP